MSSVTVLQNITRVSARNGGINGQENSDIPRKIPNISRGISPIFVRKLAVKVKVEVKFTLEQATKAQRESRVIALLFL